MLGSSLEIRLIKRKFRLGNSMQSKSKALGGETTQKRKIERDLKLEGERRENYSAFLLENLADIVAGGGRKRQANRLPHLFKTPMRNETNQAFSMEE